MTSAGTRSSMTPLLLDVVYSELGLAAPRHPEAIYESLLGGFERVKRSLVAFSPQDHILGFVDCNGGDLGRLQLDGVQESGLFIALYKGINAFNAVQIDCNADDVLTHVVYPVCRKMLSDNRELRDIVSVQARVHADKHGEAVRERIRKDFAFFGLDPEVLAAACTPAP